MDCDTNFKVTMSIKKESDGVPVFYKVDGQRFKKEKTVKLMVDTPYRVDFSFKPTQTMTRAVICGEEVEATERVYDSTASAYSSRLHTEGTLPSPKGTREDLPFLVQASLWSLTSDTHLQQDSHGTSPPPVTSSSCNNKGPTASPAALLQPKHNSRSLVQPKH
ncbi:CB1 cannabinoid receptor-interacting protein 1-like [Panulirus ornatus]|uniref:CB1 cannabinoid receptor-interacting protein 1-like n=1 Tax=Panulirus ornatus TaxID=150431 RepID=UPI003A8887F1